MMPHPQASPRATVVFAAALTLAAAAAYALLVPGPAVAHTCAVCAVCSLLTLVCAAMDGYYAIAATAILTVPTLCVVSVAVSAALHRAPPLVALASRVVFVDVCLCVAAAVVLAVPLLTAASAPSRRRVGRVAVFVTALVATLFCACSVVHHFIPTDPSTGTCGAAAAASVQRRLLALSSALVVTSWLSAAVLLRTSVPMASVRAAVVVVVLCVAASVVSDWRSHPAACHAEVVAGVSSLVLSQVLRLMAVAIVLPLMVAVACVSEAAEEDNDGDDSDDDDGTKCVVVLTPGPLNVV